MRFQPRSWAATLLKILFGLGVFSATVGAWAAMQHRALMHTPLPDAGGRQGRCVVWFVGSSSIHRWTTLQQDMQPWVVHNRGVGGALIPELAQRFANEPAVTPPEAIVFYGGDNDIAHGEQPDVALGEFRDFLAAWRAKMPRVPLLVLSLKPSPKRWPSRALQVAYDRGLRGLAERTPGLRFVDASAGMLVGGRPGPFFGEDGIHMNMAGYVVWARSVLHALNTDLPAQAERCAKEQH